MNKSVRAAFGILATSAAICLAADPAGRQEVRTVHYIAKQGTVRLEGRSSIRDWVVEGREIQGFFKAAPDFPSQLLRRLDPREVSPIGAVCIPARSLKSLDKDGAPYSDVFDEILYEKLGGRMQPKIQFWLQGLVWMSAQTNVHVFTSTGQLVVNGITNKVEFPVAIAKSAKTQLRITGEVPINPSDFGIMPPIVDPPVDPSTRRTTVKVSFDWVVEAAEWH